MSFHILLLFGNVTSNPTIMTECRQNITIMAQCHNNYYNCAIMWMKCYNYVPISYLVIVLYQNVLKYRPYPANNIIYDIQPIK